ncbi:two-component system, NarL family, sensor histidine kinase RcsD [Rosenbergiella nectarea]|uniref:histidine kinase n=1 Tax=Rosenbergiella nectarea TaxID=988801 RepID=A0A1H9L9F8_9GAMM|nr:phosphotransferase RcsD [Rosenbergiella nectarea]SER08141.1 two-component system, NarL family, sensor histidine kinase RcsD [Rosenbergiella nectarea]
MLFKIPEMTPNNLRKLLIVLLTLLIISFISLIYSSSSAIVEQQGSSLSSFTHSLQNRIEKYRYISWQIFDSATQGTTATLPGPVNQSTLQPGIFAVSTSSPKIETLIFGEHELATQNLAAQISQYTETLWASAKLTWALYYLNGEDNSLAVITNGHLIKTLNRYEGRNIAASIAGRRNEMLQQSNTLDEKESFSALRRNQLLSRGAFITLRTTFNQPGHLATILAVDLPLDDLNNNALDLSALQIHNEESVTKKSAKGSYFLNLSALSIDLLRPVSGAPLTVTYHLPLMTVFHAMIDELLPVYLILFALILLTAGALFFVHENKAQPTNKVDPWVEKLQQFTQELVKNFPMGYLIYDANQGKILLSNDMSDHLVQHLNFKKMVDMSSNPFELLQVTVNNEIYQVRHHTSQIISHYHIFTFREQNREQLVSQQLQNAQAMLEKNHTLRRQFFEQLSNTFSRPMYQVDAAVAELLVTTPTLLPHSLLQGVRSLSRLTRNIEMLNTVESGKYPVNRQSVDLQQILDDVIAENQPMITEKAVLLVVDNSELTQSTRLGDETLIFQIITTVLRYSIENTVWGKIKLKISQSAEFADRLLLEIVDTGPGLSAQEQENIDFPFISAVSAKVADYSTSLDLFFCKQLLALFDSALTIESKSHIGTRYQMQLVLPPENDVTEDEGKLLEDVRVLVSIVADDIRHIVCRQLLRWGAKYDFPEDRYSGQQCDLMITDDVEQLDDWGVLLSTNSELLVSDPRQRQANVNISRSILDAIMALIEQQIGEDVISQGEEAVSTSLWESSEYYSIFEQTVKEDMDKLRSEITQDDYSALALTAHRLKGVFAMLTLQKGKTICEEIESQIEQHQKLNITNSISELQNYVDSLLQQGSQKNE